MLLLTRKKNQVICIGDEIEVTIVHIKGNVVKVGIDAPKTIRVIRKEKMGVGAAIADEHVPAQQMGTVKVGTYDPYSPIKTKPDATQDEESY